MFDIKPALPRVKKSFIIGLAAGAVLTLVVVVTVIVFQGPPKPKAVPVAPNLTEGKEKLDLSVYDFALPDEIERFLLPSPQYFREPREKWTREEVDRFWKDPRALGIEVLTRENRRKLDELFQNVP